MINSSRVLVLAMLSSASGWGLPSHDSLLSSNGMGGVDGARDQRQLINPDNYRGKGDGRGGGPVSRQPRRRVH